MKKLYLTLFSVLILVFLLSAQNTRFGFGLGAGFSMFINIGKDSLFYGHSGAPYTSYPQIKFSGGIFAQTELSKQVFLEYGVRFIEKGQVFNFKYYNELYSMDFDETLAIHLQYLDIPWNVNYSIKKSKHGNLILIAGFSTGVLLREKENYEEIVYELLGLPNRFFTRFTLNGETGIGYDFLFSDESRFAILLNANLGVISPIRIDTRYGFMTNLASSRNFLVSLNLKYFL